MSLGAREIETVVAELAPAVAGSTIQDVGGSGDAEVLLVLAPQDARESEPRRPLRVLLSFREGCVRLHRLTLRAPEGLAPPAAAIARLAAKLRGAEVVSLANAPGDRVATFVLRSAGRSLVLRFELFSTRPTWVLVGDDGRILDLRAPVRTRHRTLAVGAPDAPPVAPPFEPPPSRFPPAGPRFQANDAIEAHYAPLARVALLEEARTTLRRRVRDRLANRDDRIRGMRVRLEESAGADDLRRRAELLSGARHGIPRGASEARVVDWFDPATPEVTIELDPSVDLAVAIERLFTRARRLTEGIDRVREELAAAQASRAVLAAALEAIDAADGPEPLSALESSLLRDGHLSEPTGRRAAAKRAVSPPGSRRFVSRDGLTILVGKGARDNDRLTFQTARGNDLWLHVSGGVPGSHVVVRMPREASPPEETLLDAATLAVHYSKVRGAGRAEVLWTLRKHVTKARGGPPGLVHVAGEKRILVDLDRARLERLLRGDDAGA